MHEAGRGREGDSSVGRFGFDCISHIPPTHSYNPLDNEFHNPLFIRYGWCTAYYWFADFHSSHPTHPNWGNCNWVQCSAFPCRRKRVTVSRDIGPSASGLVGTTSSALAALLQSGVLVVPRENSRACIAGYLKVQSSQCTGYWMSRVESA